MAAQGTDPEPGDDHVIEVPPDGPDTSQHVWPSNQSRSTITPMGEATLGRGWYSVGAARRGPKVTRGAVAFLIGLLIGPSVTWLVWGIAGSPLILGPAASAVALFLAWRLGASRRLMQGWVFGFSIHLAVVALVVLTVSPMSLVELDGSGTQGGS